MLQLCNIQNLIIFWHILCNSADLSTALSRNSKWDISEGIMLHLKWQSLSHFGVISAYGNLSSKLRLHPANWSMFSTFKNPRDSIWSQQSTCTENLLDLFQILSFVILSMDLAYRQTLTLLTLKGIYLMIWLLCYKLFENSTYVAFNRNGWWSGSSIYLG